MSCTYLSLIWFINTPRPERNPEHSSNNSERSENNSLEVPRKYIVPNESIIGAKIIFISSFAMSIAMVISYQFVNNIDQKTTRKTGHFRTILLIDDYFAPLWQSCNLALFLFLGNDDVGKYVKQRATFS